MGVRSENYQGEGVIRVLMVAGPDAATSVSRLLATLPNPSAITLRSTDTADDIDAHAAIKDVDLILLDLSHPEVGGWNGVERLRARVPGKPLVVLAEETDEEAPHAVRLGAQELVVKSRMNAASLAVALRHAMERFQSEQTLRRYRDHLETLVHARNTELRRANEQLRREIGERERVERDLRDSNMRLSHALTELKRTELRLIQNERLRALGQMAAGIMHDFNNALMPIVGYSDLLLNSSETLDNRIELIKILHSINTASRKAADEIRRLREFYGAPGDTSEWMPLDLNRMLASVVEATRPRWQQELAAKDIHVEVTTDLQPIPPVHGRPDELKEAFINILLNALDAMPNGGNVIIRTSGMDDEVRIDFEDTGCGMTDEVRLRCFEPFFTTKGDHGSGLGLSMVYGIVKSHGGQVNISSAQGTGTKVSLRLPAVLAPTAAEKTMRKISDLNVLVIDDDEEVTRLLGRYLAGSGHRATIASCGTAGIEAFDKADFDLVITDRAMPDISGDAVAAAIRGKNETVPIIMLTGFGDLMKDTGISPEGVDLILSKPVTMEELCQAILQALGSRRRRDAPDRPAQGPAPLNQFHAEAPAPGTSARRAPR